MRGQAANPQDYVAAFPDVGLPPRPLPRVVVVVCARSNEDGVGQQKLNLTLASLSAQDYPPGSLVVRVVDDGSTLPLALPDCAPAGTTLIRLSDDGPSWGKARAANAGAHALEDDDLLFLLDSDMVLHPSHISKLAALCSRSDKIVAFGYKRICPDYVDNAVTVSSLLEKGRFDEVPIAATEKHQWLEDYIDSTAALTTAGPDVFRAVTGATLMLSAKLWKHSGGYDEAMTTAEDTELGYRLCQRGAVVVPVPQARSWHLGRTTMTLHRDAMLEHNKNLLAPRVPLLRHLRNSTTSWKVPTLIVDVLADQSNALPTSGLVDALLAGKLGVDVRIRVVSEPLSMSRYLPAADDLASLRALHRRFEFDERVKFVSSLLEDAFPSPYYARIPGHLPLAGLRRMLDILESKNVGVVAAALPEHYGFPCSLWRTSAVARSGVTLSAVLDRAGVASVAPHWGLWWLDPAAVGIHPGRVTYQADPVLSRSGGGPARSYAASAYKAWARASFSPQAAQMIAGAVARGVSRRARRTLKSGLQRAVVKL